jgi:hypothetical protein
VPGRGPSFASVAAGILVDELWFRRLEEKDAEVGAAGADLSAPVAEDGGPVADSQPRDLRSVWNPRRLTQQRLARGRGEHAVMTFTLPFRG